MKIKKSCYRIRSSKRLGAFYAKIGFLGGRRLTEQGGVSVIVWGRRLPKCASSLGRTFQRRAGNSLSTTSDNTGCQRRQLRNIIGIFWRPCGVSSNGRQAVYPSKYEYNYHYCMSFHQPRHYVKITHVYLRRWDSRWSRRKQRIIIIYVQLAAVTKSWNDLE